MAGALAVALALGVAPPAAALSWVRALGGAGDDEIRAVVAGADRTLVVAGATDSAGSGGFDAWIAAVGPCGAPNWTRVVGSPGDDAVLAAAAAPGGGLIAVGETTASGGDLDVLLLEFDAVGNLARQQTLGGAGDESAAAVAVLPDGGRLVAALLRATPSAAADVLAIRLDAAGDLVWQRSYGAAGEDEPRAVVGLPDGGAVIAATTDSFGAGLFDAWLIRVDPAGEVVWQRAYGGPTDDLFAGLALLDETLVAVGSSDSFGEGLFDAWIVGLATVDGSIAWQRTYGGIDDDQAFAVAADPVAGRAYVAGSAASFAGGGDDAFVLAIDQAGAIDWHRRLGAGGLDQFAAALVDVGGIAIAGLSDSWGGPGFDGLLARVGFDGDTSLACNPLSAESLTLGTSAAVAADTAATSPIVSGAALADGALTVQAGPATTAPVCAAGPGEVSPPGSSQPLRFTGAATLAWEPAGASCADAFNLYRGDLVQLAADEFGAPLACALAGSSAGDAATPGVGDGFVYLVTAVTAGVEGTAGFGSARAARPLVPCP